MPRRIARKPKIGAVEVKPEDVAAAYEPLDEPGAPTPTEPPQGEPVADEPEQQPEPTQDEPAAAVAVGENPVPGFDPQHLAGQLGDWLLTELKLARHVKPWNELTEVQQRQLIERTYARSKEVVAGAVDAVARRGFASIDAVFDSGAFKGEELVLKLKALRTAGNIGACVNNGRIVQLVFCDAAQFAGAMIVKPAPDQPDLVDAAEEAAEVEEAEADEEEFDEETGELPAAGLM